MIRVRLQYRTRYIEKDSFQVLHGKSPRVRSLADPPEIIVDGSFALRGSTIRVRKSQYARDGFHARPYKVRKQMEIKINCDAAARGTKELRSRHGSLQLNDPWRIQSLVYVIQMRFAVGVRESEYRINR